MIYLPTSNGKLTEVLCCVPGKDKESKMLSVPKTMSLTALLHPLQTKNTGIYHVFGRQMHKWAKHDLIEAVSLPINTDGERLET